MTGMAAAPFCPVTFMIISIFNRSYPNIQIPCKVMGFFLWVSGVFSYLPGLLLTYFYFTGCCVKSMERCGVFVCVGKLFVCPGSSK